MEEVHIATSNVPEGIGRSDCSGLKQVAIPDYKEAQDTSNGTKYILYFIHSEFHDISIGEVSVERRYTHFQWLLESLRKKHPGKFIPELPPKQVVKKAYDQLLGRDGFVPHRMRGLELFVNRLAKDSTLSNDSLVRDFLSEPDADILRQKLSVPTEPKPLTAVAMQQAQKLWNMYVPSFSKQTVKIPESTEFDNITQYVSNLKKRFEEIKSAVQKFQVQRLEMAKSMLAVGKSLESFSRLEADSSIGDDSKSASANITDVANCMTQSGQAVLSATQGGHGSDGQQKEAQKSGSDNQLSTDNDYEDNGAADTQQALNAFMWQLRDFIRYLEGALVSLDSRADIVLKLAQAASGDPKHALPEAEVDRLRSEQGAIESNIRKDLVLMNSLKAIEFETSIQTLVQYETSLGQSIHQFWAQIDRTSNLS